MGLNLFLEWLIDDGMCLKNYISFHVQGWMVGMKHYKDGERRESIIGLKRTLKFFRVELLLLVQDT